VSVAVVDEGLVEATVVNTRAGTVEACRRSKLALPAGGQISRMWVKEGDRVKRGQKLLELWNRDLVRPGRAGAAPAGHDAAAAAASLHPG